MIKFDLKGDLKFNLDAEPEFVLMTINLDLISLK